MQFKKSQTMKTQWAHRSPVIMHRSGRLTQAQPGFHQTGGLASLHPAVGSPTQHPAMCFPGLDPAPHPASLHLCTQWPRRFGISLPRERISYPAMKHNIASSWEHSLIMLYPARRSRRKIQRQMGKDPLRLKG